MLKMQWKLFLVLLSLGLCVYGLPLELSTDNMDQYFSPHIVGGSNAPDSSAPYMAALVAGEMFTLLACGGSIVLPTLILTAAHCIETFVVPSEHMEDVISSGAVSNGLLSTFHAVVGATNWFTQGTAVQFKDYYIHPQWDNVHIKNDIGFLVVEKQMVMSETLKMVALNFDWVGGGEPSSVTGWGRISNWGLYPFHLQLMDVDTISPRQCINKVNEASLWWGGSSHVNPAIEICTFHSFGVGLCHGDSGSPLVSRKTGKQIGIASWAFPCAHGAPDMYVRVSGYKDYIKSIMSKHQ